ncbi:MAG: UDP-3-O-(3-hydroxymyristoyl)glucosamine N-acyltransferase [Planctomycetota bacterium]
MSAADTPEAGQPLSGAQIAALVDGTLEGDAPGPFTHVRDLASATASDVIFFRSGPNEMGRPPAPAEFEALAASAAGLRLVDAGTEVGDGPCVRVENPGLAAARLAQHFEFKRPLYPAGIHSSAVVEEGAQVPASASLGPGCVVREGALLEEDVVLVAQVYVGEGSVVGEGSILHPGVYVGPRVKMGAGCVVQANTSLGAAGFGYVWSGSEHVAMPQVGGVVLGNRVEIGANSCIDAGTFTPTIIGDNCLLDNHVQVGHNCELGRFVILCGKVGISGSVKIGDGAIFAGSSGAAGHISIGPGAKVGAKAAVTSDVAPGQTVAGNPAVDFGLHQRMQALVRRMARQKS